MNKSGVKENLSDFSFYELWTIQLRLVKSIPYDWHRTGIDC